jgi:hypothetical protein
MISKALGDGSRGTIGLVTLLLFFGAVSLGAACCEVMAREAWIGAVVGGYLGLCWCLALHMALRADAAFLSVNEVKARGEALPAQYLIRLPASASPTR